MVMHAGVSFRSDVDYDRAELNVFCLDTQLFVQGIPDPSEKVMLLVVTKNNDN